MNNLLYKEFKLSIHKAIYMLIPLLSILLLIPNWPYFIALMYFFFISIPNIFGAYNAQKDMQFSVFMPVKKSDVVKSKIIAISIIELIHLLSAVLFGMIHYLIFGNYNFFLDIGFSYFGLSFIMYGVFNLIFFPLYFKTAYKYGIPLIIGVIVTLIYATIIEFSVILNPTIAYHLENKDKIFFQLLILIFGILFFVVINMVTHNLSKKRFELVEL
ncbi:MAG: ABC-2 transporter permease [Spirochaetaceae bacterium]